MSSYKLAKIQTRTQMQTYGHAPTILQQPSNG
jgi:hypothetical protein